MTKSEMAARLKATDSWVPGKRIKIDLGEEGVVLLDGIACKVSEDEGEADTVISLSWADLKALERNELNPMLALMQGRLRVEGDMAGAMQLQGVIANLRSGD